MKIEDIAKVCYDANAAYAVSLGDNSFLPWDQAPEWQRSTNVKGVQFIKDNPSASPSASHESWMAEKLKEGWKRGPVKDPAKKEHPCMVAYDALPVEQKAKDYIFGAITRSLLPLLERVPSREEQEAVRVPVRALESEKIPVPAKNVAHTVQQIESVKTVDDSGKITVDLSKLSAQPRN